MRIMGIDPGLTRCGVGVIDLNNMRKTTFVGVHVIRTDVDAQLPARLLTLEVELADLIREYQPDHICVERVFSQLNVRTAMGTAQASAVALLSAERLGIATSMYTPTEVKAGGSKMIASVTGKVLETRIDGLVVAIGGVGMLVMCAPQTVAQARLNQEITLATSLIVREDSLTLYGFESAESRELFDIIQSVSGFGAKLAFTIVSTFEPDELRAAIGREDVVRLTKTPGVGAKGAQRLILELKDRIGYVGGTESQSNSAVQQVQQALVGLGYTAKDAQRATQDISVIDSDDVSTLLKSALQILANS